MVTWKIKGLYKADAEAVYSEITAIGDSFSPEQIVEAAFPKQTIIELFNMAGTFIGVGSRRGEGYGRFHVTEVK